MRNTRFMLRAACYLLLIKEDKILLLRRFNTGWEDGKYTLISGHLEGNETVKQAMIREAKEEAAIVIKSRELHVVHTMHRKSNNNFQYIDFFLVADKWQGKPQIMEHNKCDDMKWFPLKNLPKNTLPHIKQAIESYFRIFHFPNWALGNCQFSSMLTSKESIRPPSRCVEQFEALKEFLRVDKEDKRVLL